MYENNEEVNFVQFSSTILINSVLISYANETAFETTLLFPLYFFVYVSNQGRVENEIIILFKVTFFCQGL